MGLSLIFIAHDLAVVKHISDRVLVMYLGNAMELGSDEEVYNNTKHPYTKALMSAVPIPDQNWNAINPSNYLKVICLLQLIRRLVACSVLAA